MKITIKKENGVLKIVAPKESEVIDEPFYEFKGGFHCLRHDNGILKIPQNEPFQNITIERLGKIHGVTFEKAKNEAKIFLKKRLEMFNSIRDTPKQQLEKSYLLKKYSHKITVEKTHNELTADPKNFEFDNEKLNTALEWVKYQRNNVKEQIIFEKLEEKKDLFNYELLLLDRYEKELRDVLIENEPTADSRKKNDLSQPQICALIWYLSKYENKYQITDISGTGTVLDAIIQVFKDFGFTGQPTSTETKFADIRYKLNIESYENISKFSEYGKLIPYLNDYPKAQKALSESLSNYNEKLKRPK